MSSFSRSSTVSTLDTGTRSNRRLLPAPTRTLLPVALALLLWCQASPAQIQPRTVAAVAETAVSFGAVERAALQGSGTVAVAHSRGAAFEIVRSTSGAAGADVARAILFGPAFMGQKYSQSAANVYAESLRLVDPSPIVAQAFFEKLLPEVTADRIRVLEEAVAPDDADALRAKVPQGLAVVVRTTEWRIEIVPEAGAGQQRVFYAVAASAVQLPGGMTVWRAACRATTPEPTSGNELRRDEGRLLKRRLAECASACADELWASFAGAGTSPQAPR